VRRRGKDTKSASKVEALSDTSHVQNKDSIVYLWLSDDKKSERRARTR